MAQILVYKVVINIQNENFVQTNNLDQLLNFLKESGMIIYDSLNCDESEKLFFKLVNLTFPYVTILDVQETIISEEIIKSQLIKEFKLVDKKKKLIEIFQTIKE